MPKTLTFRAPDALAKEIEVLAKEEKLDKSSLISRLLADAVQNKRITKALNLYKDGKISIGKAAEIAQVSIWEMLDLITEKGIHIDYGNDELLEDIKLLRRRICASGK